MPPRVPAKMRQLFHRYTDSILKTNFYPQTPIETLESRLTATWMLQNTPAALLAAENFIKKTSTHQKDDLQRLTRLSLDTQAWHDLTICSVYENNLGKFVEYQLSLERHNRNEVIHQHAQFEMQPQGACFVSQTAPFIRIIGDPILQQPGTSFPQHPTKAQSEELARQIALAKTALVKTHGAGIAANQCAHIDKPYRFAIVGVFNELPEHVAGVNRRYPNTKPPQAIIMVNPVILDRSFETQVFNHACLSLPCSNRCAVESPESITVQYQDPLNNMAFVVTTMSGFDAVLLWHEMNHISDGLTYFDTAFASLPAAQQQHFLNLVTEHLRSRQANPIIPDLSIQPFRYTVQPDAQHHMTLHPDELISIMPNMTTQTLQGLQLQCRAVLCKGSDASSAFFDKTPLIAGPGYEVRLLK
ncbi:MAG: peptide deformylase [Gammaproteobacteria bacterium]|nr:peptide deformylase [Gammaproteobacteria bacterium]